MMFKLFFHTLVATSLFSSANLKADFFVEKVVPIIENHCIRCHNPDNSEGKLSLSNKEAWLKGGREGAVAHPFKAETSLITYVITPEDEQTPAEMPEESEPLTEEQVDTLKKWINDGMVWTEGVVIQQKSKADKSFWSLQPIQEPEVPNVASAPRAWKKNNIDRFIYAKLEEKNLTPSIRADKRALIRRVSFDLHGLPPSPQMVENFIHDKSDNAYLKLIDQLLASPRYGERWGRHWLDVVRFAESSGFERNRIRDNAWPFRDYVIKSFNQDKPFDDFIKEHLAGDQLVPLLPEREIGTAFLVAGGYDDVGNQDPVAKKQIRANTLDDIITATGSAFLAMSINCSRCHDHKFDPIEQKDYYRLRAAFEGVQQGSRTIASVEKKREHYDKLKPLKESFKTIKNKLNELEKEPKTLVKKNRALWLKDYPRSPINAEYTEETFSPIEAKHIRFTVLSLSRVMLEEFEVWSSEPASKNLALKKLGGQVQVSSMRYSNDDPEAYGAHHLNDGVYGSFWVSDKSKSFLTVSLKQTTLINKVVFSNNRTKTKNRSMPQQYNVEISTDGNTWHKVASHEGRKPTNMASLDESFLKKAMTDNQKNERSKLKKELQTVESQIRKLGSLPTYWAGKFNREVANTFLLKGGDVTKENGIIPPEGLSFLDENVTPFQLKPQHKEGERRLALANWMVDKTNPLTARVLVNRIWQYYFGRGIVSTPSDFGYMGTRPSHPELLDWLAIQLQKNDWKIKAIHRLIMTSETYLQSSAYNVSKSKMDADSVYLWRFPPKRLEAEAIRDSLLHVSGLLNLKMYGPGFRLYKYTVDNVATYYSLDNVDKTTYRRAVYHQTPRSVRLDLMTEYDMPDCSLSKPKRSVTVSPLQALTHLNHSFVMDVSKSFSARLIDEAPKGIGDQILLAYQLLFSRSPEPKELDLAKDLIREHGLLVFCRALLNSNEVIYVD